jgi:hypothetical protein
MAVEILPAWLYAPFHRFYDAQPPEMISLSA